MFQIRHLFLTDLKRLHVMVIFYALVLIGAAISTWIHCEDGFIGGQRNLSRNLTDCLPMVVAVWLGSLVLLTDSVYKPTAFWRIHPWSRKLMGLAKVLFLVLVVVVPLGIVSSVEAFWFRLDLTAVLAEMFGVTVTVFAALLWVWFAATCTSKGGLAFRFVCLLILVVFLWGPMTLGDAGKSIYESPLASSMKGVFWPLFRGSFEIPVQLATHLSVLSVVFMVFVVGVFQIRRKAVALVTYGVVLVMLGFLLPALGEESLTSSRVPEISYRPGISASELRLYRESDQVRMAHVTLNIPERGGAKTSVSGRRIRAFADGEKFQSRVDLSLRGDSEKRHLERLLGVVDEESASFPDVWMKCSVPNVIAEKAKRFHFEGDVAFSVADLASLTSFPLSGSGIFRSEGLVCKVKRFERPILDPGFEVVMGRTFDGDDASEGEFVEMTSVDLRPIGEVHVYACQRPWVRLLNSIRGKEVNAMVIAAWNPSARSAIESSHEYIEDGHSYMEIHPTSDPLLLSSAQLAVYNRTNERTEVESFVDAPVVPVRVR